MKIIVTKILSLNADGACSYLVNIGNEAKILLDCGIGHDFNFQPYLKFKQQIQSVNLILISHSSIEYAGALPFLIQEFQLQPKIVFTSQPVMRYSPLNLHQEILNLRLPNYDKKVFNKIYSYFESIQVIKPYQKKAISIELTKNDDSLLRSTKKSIYFSCYQSGGSLSGLTWKMRMGLVNILYLVDYNNFSLNHTNGLDFEAIKTQPVSLLLTDMCPQISDDKIKKDKIYIDIKNILIDFYARQNIDPVRPRPFFGENQRRILFTCYPNEMLIEIMITLRKVITDMQEAMTREKVVVVHLSSRYLQLIKSQVDNFSDDTKGFVDKIDEFFIHSKNLTSRINLSSANHVNGILNPALVNNESIEIYHFGEGYSFTKNSQNFESGRANLSGMRMFKQEAIPQERIQTEVEAIKQEPLKAQKLQEQIQIKEQQIQQTDNINLKITRSLSSLKRQEKQNIGPYLGQASLGTQTKQKQLVGKYLSQISFPHFVKSHKQEEFEFNQYGLKHHLEPSSRPQKRTILDVINSNNNQDVDGNLPELGLVAKKSTVQVMNIQFGVEENFVPIDITQTGRVIETHFSRTNFASSLRVIQVLNPKHVFMLNSSSDPYHQKLFKKYKSNVKTQLYNLSASPRNQCIVQLLNQIVQYKVNYLPLNQNALQKVKGRIQSVNGVIHLHIQVLEQKQVLEFRMEKFYKLCKHSFGRQACKFTGNGILIAGVKIYRQDNEIIVEGQYSQAYFKVRSILYEFLQIR